MQKPIIVTTPNQQMRGMTDFEIRGITSYLNELLEYMHDEPLNSDTLFGLAYVRGVLGCTENPSAEWLLPNHDTEIIAEEYTIHGFWLSQTGILYANLRHISNDHLTRVVRIN